MNIKNQAGSSATTTVRKKIRRTEHSNIAFKCNYCDGGKSSSSIGFNGICSDKIIHYNIEIVKRRWCSFEDSPCFNYLHGKLSRDELEADFDAGGYVCYESQMLRDWKAMAGVIQSGERKGQPVRLRNARSNSLCVLTTLEPNEPNSSEADRIIFAVFLIDETYEGGDHIEGSVSTQSKFKLSLSQTEAQKMRFWRYYANKNIPEKAAWGTGLYRYLTDIQALQILRDIAIIKRNTKDEALATEFLTTFSKIVEIEVKDVGSFNGALTKT